MSTMSRTSLLARSLHLILAGLAFSTSTLVVGCAEKAAPEPPSLRAPAPAVDPVKPSMWALSGEVGVLRELTERSAPPDEKDRAEMERRLARVDEILKALAALPDASKHPLLSTELGTFQDDVKAAREAVAREPFDVAKIRVVTDGCKRCHVVAAAETSRTQTLAARP